MKKVCSLICLVLVLLSIALPASAQEKAKTEDSVTISEDVLACLDMQNIDTVFCVYDFEDQFLRCYYEIFDTYGDIDGVLANFAGAVIQRYYFVKDKSGETHVYTYDGTSLSEGHNWGSGWFNTHSEEAESIIQQIDSGIVVEHIYYLVFYSWCAVCYKTNLGDYVYVSTGKEEYLMGKEPFMALQGELKDMAIKFQDWRNLSNEPYHIKLSELRVDLSPYDISSPDFDPHAPLRTDFIPGKLIGIGFVVLLAALIVCRVLVRNRRKTRNEEISVNRL